MNKLNGCLMVSYNNNERSNDIKSTKIEPTIYIVILMIEVPIAITAKALTLMKTAIKTVIRIII